MAAIRAEQLEAQLARQLASVYVIHGDEPLLSLEAADAIRIAARKVGFTQRSVLINERGFKWGELHAAGASMSLFGDKNLVELRIPTGKPGTEGGEAIANYCAHISPDTLLMVSLPRLAKRDQSAAWFTALTRAGTSVDIWPVERARLPEWISTRLARQKQRASREALQFLADCVEGNLLAAHQEVQKLALLLPPGELPFDELRAAVLNVARYDAGKLSEAMLSGDIARLARMLEGLRAEGEAPPRILWILADEIRAIAMVKDGLASGRQLADLCRENRVWGEPRQTLVGRAAQRLTRAALHAALSRAARIDRMVKGVAKGDVWDELMQLGLALGAKRQAA
ncbi:MAG: DNA polymerase III subunit delta [Burkholderiales bacterium]